MKKLNNKKFVAISFMLFSMFFGAGNFIFPPMLGKESGKIFYETIIFFCLTAVVFPILEIVSVAKNGSINALTGKVDKYFGPIFIILIYLAIGPFLAIPRASTLPFEVTFVSFKESRTIALFFWSILFFIINYFVSVNKSKIVEILGKVLTPILLVLVITLVTGVFFIDTPSFSNPIGKYVVSPYSTAFLQGYNNTMDAMGCVLAIVVINALRKMGITNEKRLEITTIKAGIFAGIILSIIYILLAYLGVATVNIIGETTNGAEILSKTALYLFGKSGQLLLSVAIFLACLTTTVGLTVSGSEYFNGLVPKIKYKIWCLFFSFISFCLANIGLNGILQYGIPILTAFYPVVLVLILLGLLDNFIDSSRLVYRSCIYVASITGLACSLGTINGFLPNSFVVFFKIIMPFYTYGLGWFCWVVVTFCITFIIHIIVSKISKK